MTAEMPHEDWQKDLAALLSGKWAELGMQPEAELEDHHCLAQEDSQEFQWDDLQAKLHAVVSRPPSFATLLDHKQLWATRGLIEYLCVVCQHITRDPSGIQLLFMRNLTQLSEAASRLRSSPTLRPSCPPLSVATSCCTCGRLDESLDVFRQAELCQKAWVLCSILDFAEPADRLRKEDREHSPYSHVSLDMSPATFHQVAGAIATLCSLGPATLRAALVPCIAFLLLGRGEALRTHDGLYDALRVGLTSHSKALRTRAAESVARLLSHKALPSEVLERIAALQPQLLAVATNGRSVGMNKWGVAAAWAEAAAAAAAATTETTSCTPSGAAGSALLALRSLVRLGRVELDSIELQSEDLAADMDSDSESPSEASDNGLEESSDDEPFTLPDSVLPLSTESQCDAASSLLAQLQTLPQPLLPHPTFADQAQVQDSQPENLQTEHAQPEQAEGQLPSQEGRSQQVQPSLQDQLFEPPRQPVPCPSQQPPQDPMQQQASQMEQQQLPLQPLTQQEALQQPPHQLPQPTQQDSQPMPVPQQAAPPQEQQVQHRHLYNLQLSQDHRPLRRLRRPVLRRPVLLLSSLLPQKQQQLQERLSQFAAIPLDRWPAASLPAASAPPVALSASQAASNVGLSDVGGVTEGSRTCSSSGCSGSQRRGGVSGTPLPILALAETQPAQEPQDEQNQNALDNMDYCGVPGNDNGDAAERGMSEGEPENSGEEDVACQQKEEWLPFSPAVVDSARCLARIWKDGCGGQCSRHPKKGGMLRFCRQHLFGRWRVNGRCDGPIPDDKLDAFQRSKEKRDVATDQLLTARLKRKGIGGEEAPAVVRKCSRFETGQSLANESASQEKDKLVSDLTTALKGIESAVQSLSQASPQVLPNAVFQSVGSQASPQVLPNAVFQSVGPQASSQVLPNAVGLDTVVQQASETSGKVAASDIAKRKQQCFVAGRGGA